MKELSVKHPLLFGAVLAIASLIVAGVITAMCSIVGMSAELGTVVGRFIVAIALIVVFGECFSWNRSFSGIALAWPVLIVVAWNVFNHLASGCEFVTPSALIGAIILGLAPGFFEEVLFRGIVIDRLRKSGKDAWFSLWASAILFSLIHLTNAARMDLASLLVQVGYSLVIGLLLGAIYIKSGDIVSVILAHSAIDISNQIFATQSTTASIPMVIAFVVVLVVLLVCALRIAPRPER